MFRFRTLSSINKQTKKDFLSCFSSKWILPAQIKRITLKCKQFQTDTKLITRSQNKSAKK